MENFANSFAGIIASQRDTCNTICKINPAVGIILSIYNQRYGKYSEISMPGDIGKRWMFMNRKHKKTAHSSNH